VIRALNTALASEINLHSGDLMTQAGIEEQGGWIAARRACLHLVCLLFISGGL
jgi:hypothetical protein